MRDLKIDSIPLQDQDLVFLKSMTKIQWFELNKMPITSQGLRHIERLTNLEVLRLQDAKIDRLESLRSLTKLWLLNLSGNPINDDSLPALTILPKLTELELTRTKITDKGLKYLAACPSLVTLRLDGTAITDAGLSEFSKCPKLRSVSIRETKISDEALAAFRKIHPTIRFYR